MVKQHEKLPSRQHFKTAISTEIVGALAQLFLVFLGVRYLLSDDSPLVENQRLLLWCLVATVYLATAAIWLNTDLRRHHGDHEVVKRLSTHPVVRLMTSIVTLSSSVVGLIAAATLILTRGEPEYLSVYEIIAVWAMLASWALFQWGYARIYFSHYHRFASDRPLRFPETSTPRLIDFVYFAFTNGTSFAPSDVAVTTSRMRWTVVWHTTFSFFFNALSR